MSIVLQAAGLVGRAPGSWLYHVVLILVLCLLGSMSAARRRRVHGSSAGLLGLSVGALAALHLAALIVAFAATASSPLHPLIPPLDRAISTLDLIFLLVALTFPEPGNIVFAAAAAAGLALTGALAITWLLWASAAGVGAKGFNGSAPDTLWICVQVGLLVAGVAAIVARRPRAWAAGIGLLSLLLVGLLLHYLFPIRNSDLPGQVNLAEIIVWPLSAAWLLNRWRSPGAVAASPRQVAPAKFQATSVPGALAATDPPPAPITPMTDFQPEVAGVPAVLANHRETRTLVPSAPGANGQPPAHTRLAKTQPEVMVGLPALVTGEVVPDGALASWRAALQEQQAARCEAEQRAEALSQRLAHLDQAPTAMAATDRAAQLQAAREQAQTAAKFALELNTQLGAARAREQQFQQTGAATQSALEAANEAFGQEQRRSQAQQAARQEAEAAVQLLTSQIATARSDIRWLSGKLDNLHCDLAGVGRDRDAIAEQLSQLAAERDARQQQIAALEAELQTRRQEGLEAQAQCDTQAKQMAELRQAMQEAQRQTLFAQGTLQSLRTGQQAGGLELQKLRQQNQALEKQAVADQQAWQTAQQAWAKQRAGLQAALEATRRQLLEAHNAAMLGRAKLETSSDQVQTLTRRLRETELALAASESAYHSARAESDERLAELEKVQQQFETARVQADRQSQPSAETSYPVEANPLVDALVAVGPAKKNGAAPAAIASETSEATVVSQPAGVDPSPRALIIPDLSVSVAAGSCPHLGLATDRDTRHGFASVANRCYALKAPQETTLAQQDNFCLHAAHTQCPIFTGEFRSPRVPINTEAEAAQHAKRKGPRLGHR